MADFVKLRAIVVFEFLVNAANYGVNSTPENIAKFEEGQIISGELSIDEISELADDFVATVEVIPNGD